MSFQPAEPYTFQEHFRRALEARQRGDRPPEHVQVRLFKITRCARILDVWFPDADGAGVWKLKVEDDLGVGVHHCAARFVRPCEGIDGRCQCAGEATRPAPVTSVTGAPAPAGSNPGKGAVC